MSMKSAAHLKKVDEAVRILGTTTGLNVLLIKDDDEVLPQPTALPLVVCCSRTLSVVHCLLSVIRRPS